jgi:alanyl-tRNA synthetase
MPSSDGRGYVLRRIMRRAMRHAHILGAERSVMHRLLPALVGQMGDAFPELVRARALIEETLRLGGDPLPHHPRPRPAGSSTRSSSACPTPPALPGEAAFRLYDTYGFPLDLTQDALREKGRKVDVEGFDAAMAEQKRKRARAAWAGSGEAADGGGLVRPQAEKVGASEFLGYDDRGRRGPGPGRRPGGQPVDAAAIGAAVEVVLNQTPFYAEAGGQVGDTGVLTTPEARVAIRDVRRKAGLFVHIGTVETGELRRGAAAELVVDADRRARIRANHSATHLVHEALRRTLGDHVAQRGSLVAPDRLRFDFAHTRAMTPEERAAVEAEVNAFIRQNTAVETRIMTPEAAQDLGARALFGEKYGEEVRVVAMGRAPGSGLGASGDVYSLELCGGTHVARTGDIGSFRLVSEGASAGGVRRIEAVTSAAADAHAAAEAAALATAAGMLRSRPDELAERIRALLEERKALEAEVAELRRRAALAGDGAAPGPETVRGIPFLAQWLSGVSGKDLRSLIDEHKARLKSGVVLLVADTGDRAAVAAGVTDDLTGRISAIDLVRVAAEAMGGKGGGGRPDLAQAGGADARRAPEAIAAARALLEA